MLSFFTQGNLKAPPLLLLHGFLGSGQDFGPLLSYLKEDFFCILPDLPGHGNTKFPFTENLFEWTFIELRELLKSLKISRCAIAGYSLGARIALGFTLKLPELVSKALLISCNPGIEKSEERAQRAASDQIWSELLKTLPFPAFLERWYGQPLFEPLKNQKTAYAQMIKRRIFSDQLGPALLGYSLSKQESFWPLLSICSAPLYFLFGEKDEKFMQIQQRLTKLSGQIHTKIFKNIGHTIHLETPRSCAYAIQQFARRDPTCTLGPR